MAFNPLASLSRGLQLKQNIDEQQRQAQIQGLQQQLAQQSQQQGFDVGTNPILSQLSALDPNKANQIANNFLGLDEKRQKDFFVSANTGLSLLNQGKNEQALNLAQQRVNKIVNAGGDPTDSQLIADLIGGGQIDEAKNQLQNAVNAGMQGGFLKGNSKTADQSGFEFLTKGFTEEEKIKAKKIKLGLISKAPKLFQQNAKTFNIGGVPHILDKNGKVRRITVNGEEITTDVVANNKAEIGGRISFAKANNKDKAKIISDSFNKIQKINLGISNISRGIELLHSGAKSGAIEGLLPSIRASSIELDNVQKRIGLDIVGAVTFGALSKGELDLALSTALPKNLNEPDLIKFLEEKKTSQEKLRNYFESQISFLGKGGTISEFTDLQKSKRSIAPKDVNSLSNEDLFK